MTQKANLNFKKINTALLFFTLAVFGFYLYQTISISSGNVSLVVLKKDFLERKNTGNAEVTDNLDASFARENLQMTEIERFDYIIVGRDEFAFTEDRNESKQ